MPKSHMKRSAFIKQAIAALENNTASGSEVDAIKADRAFHKLQFDFPAASVSELDALAKVFRDSVRSKEGCSGYRLTTKIVSNAVAGALQSMAANQSPPQPMPSAQLQGNDATDADLQGAYHRLCSALLISFMKKALSLPEADAWALLDQYWPDLDQDLDQDGASTALPQDQESMLAAAAGQCMGGEDPGSHLAAPAPAPGEPTEAAQMDDDDCPYEDIEATPSSQGRTAVSVDTVSSRWAGTQPAPRSVLTPSLHLSPSIDCSWRELGAKILHLGSQLSYATISHSSVWADPATMASLLELLRVLGVHDRSEQLRPLVHAYVTLLAERMCDVPADMAVLAQVMEALGVAGLASAAPRRARAGGAPRGMPAEAAAAFDLVNHLALHFAPSQRAPQAGSLASHASARQALWHQIQQHVVPLAALSLDDLCSAEPEDLELSAVALVSQVLLVYVRQRPAGVDAAKQLLSAGVVRSLAALAPRCGSHGGAAAEPVRLLVLLCAACSREVRRWLLAVPGFCAWLDSPEMQRGGCCEAYGAVWKLLAAQQPQQQQQHGKGEDRAPAADGGSGLLALLQSTELECIPQLTATLKLMHEVHEASAGGVAWSAPLQARLRALGDELRSRGVGEAAAARPNAACEAAGSVGSSPEVEGSHSAGSQVPVGSAEAARVHGLDASMLQQPSGPADGVCEEEMDEQDGLKLPVDGTSLLKRRAKQLVPECIRIIKSLLTSGGKTD